MIPRQAVAAFAAIAVATLSFGCATGGSDEALLAASAQNIVPPAEVETVEVEMVAEEDLHCYLVRWPGSRIVVGEVCELSENQTGSSGFGAFFDPNDWEREILAPGVYRMTRKR